jgi:hypothetical protein
MLNVFFHSFPSATTGASGAFSGGRKSLAWRQNHFAFNPIATNSQANEKYSW